MKKRIILFFSIFIFLFLIIGIGYVSAVNNDITYGQKISIMHGSKWMAVNYAGGGSSAKWRGANFNKASADGDEELFYLRGGRSGVVKSGDEIKFESARTGYILQYKKNGVFDKDWIFGSKTCDCLVGSKEVTMIIYKEGTGDGDNTIRCGDSVYFQSGKYYLGVDDNQNHNPTYSDATTKFVFKIYNGNGACVTSTAPTTAPDIPDTPDTSTIPDTSTTPATISEGEIISCLELSEDDCANSSKWNYDVLENIELAYPDTTIPAGFCTDGPHSETLRAYPNCRQTLKCGCVWDDERLLGRGECAGSVWAVYTNLTADGCGDLTLEDSSIISIPSYCIKKLAGESCDDSNDCCSNICAYSPPYGDNVCLNYIPTDNCNRKRLGEECESGTQCCSERCVSQSTGKSICVAQDIIVTPICKSLGQGCNTGGECCSDVCISNAQKSQPPIAEEQPLSEESCAMESQLCGGSTGISCCEENAGAKLSCIATGSGDVGYCKKILDEASKSETETCLQIDQKCYDPLTGNDLLGDCCAYKCDLVSATCIKTDAGEGESCNALNRFCNERESLICIQGTCQYVPKYCAECVYEGGSCSINDNKCCSNLGLMCIGGECRQPTKRADRYFTIEAVYNYDSETDAESVSCSNPSLTLINLDTTEIADDEFQDNYDNNDFYAALIINKAAQYQFKFSFPIFMYFDIEDNTEELGFPCYDGVGSAQIVISRGTDIFCTRDIDMASICQLEPPAKSAEAAEKSKSGGIIGGIIGGIVNFFKNIFGLN